MRVRRRTLPTHPDDLIQWILTVQSALMKQTGLQDASHRTISSLKNLMKNIKNPSNKFFNGPNGDACIQTSKHCQRGPKHSSTMW